MENGFGGHHYFGEPPDRNVSNDFSSAVLDPQMQEFFEQSILTAHEDDEDGSQP
jgi:hypothetical protein